jgi:hypothetical protein
MLSICHSSILGIRIKAFKSVLNIERECIRQRIDSYESTPCPIVIFKHTLDEQHS